MLDNRLRLPTDYLLLLVDRNQPTIGYNGFIITSSVFISNQAFSQLVHVLHVFHIITELYLFIIDVLFTSFDILIFFFEIIHVVTNKTVIQWEIRLNMFCLLATTMKLIVFKLQWYHIIQIIISNSYSKYITVSKFEFKISPFWPLTDTFLILSDLWLIHF